MDKEQYRFFLTYAIEISSETRMSCVNTAIVITTFLNVHTLICTTIIQLHTIIM